jgi:hypothetical protein
VKFTTMRQRAGLSPSDDSLRVDFEGTYYNISTSDHPRRPDAYYGVPYADTLTAYGGEGPYAWAVDEGELPPGLALDAHRGVIAGTPSAWGTWTFTLEVASADGRRAWREHMVRLTLPPTAKCSDYPDDAIPGFASEVLEVWVKQTLEIDFFDHADCAMVRRIEAIDAYAGPIEDFAGLQNLTGATMLSFAKIPGLEDISPLKELTGLEELVLRRGAISDLTPLEALVNLDTLTLIGNAISDLRPLAGLDRLSTLHLEENEIKDVGPLAGLDGLTRLWLSYNDITDVTPLAQLTGLQVLVLVGNRNLTELQPLIDSPWLGEGDEVVLQGTGVDCEDVAALQAKGVTVQSSCESP